MATMVTRVRYDLLARPEASEAAYVEEYEYAAPEDREFLWKPVPPYVTADDGWNLIDDGGTPFTSVQDALECLEILGEEFYPWDDGPPHEYRVTATTTKLDDNGDPIHVSTEHHNWSEFDVAKLTRRNKAWANEQKERYADRDLLATYFANHGSRLDKDAIDMDSAVAALLLVDALTTALLTSAPSGDHGIDPLIALSGHLNYKLSRIGDAVRMALAGHKEDTNE